MTTNMTDAERAYYVAIGKALTSAESTITDFMRALAPKDDDERVRAWLLWHAARHKMCLPANDDAEAPPGIPNRKAMLDVVHELVGPDGGDVAD